MSTLYSPGKIGKLELRNRTVMAPMFLGYHDREGMVTDRMVEFYRLRAKGGVGLIVVGAMQIDQIRYSPSVGHGIYDDKFIPGYRRITDAVHDEGAKIFTQLMHQGRYCRSENFNGKVGVAPSPVFSRYTRETPSELTLQEITELVSFYAAGAARAVKAGFDGIEICTNSGYLIGQFLSPITNFRTDRYGGDLQARMTFLLEIVAAIREAVGSDVPVTVRIGGNDFIPGSNTNVEAKQIAVALEKAGVDAISVTGGWHETLVPQTTTEVPHGAFRYLGRAIKESVSVPVIMSNRMNVQVAETIVDEGMADFISLGRPFFADPELVNKGALKKYDEIRPCVGCNQGCLDSHFGHGDGITFSECLGNAEVGREFELLQGSTLISQVKSSNPERILVIGAGVAGLEYARVAAMRGHQVTIWEQSSQPGGQIAVASAPPGRHDFIYLKDYLVNMCEKLGVQINYQKKAVKDSIIEAYQAGTFDRVVVATGAEPIKPNIPTEEGATVVQAWDLLTKKVNVGSRVVIVGGGAVGVETALKLAEIGTIDAETLRFLMLYQAETPEELMRLLTHGTKQITLIEMMKAIGADIGATCRWGMLAQLKQFGVNSLNLTKVVAIKKDGVAIETPEGEQFIPADTVVLAVGSRSNNGLYNDLQGNIDKLTIIGDATKPRKVINAIREAYDEAIKI